MSDKLLRNAFLASILINASCVAWVGASSLVHPPKSIHHVDPSEALHPVPIVVHVSKKTADSSNRARSSMHGVGQSGDGTDTSRGDQPNPGQSNDHLASNNSWESAHQTADSKSDTDRNRNLDHYVSNEHANLHDAASNSTDKDSKASPYKVADNKIGSPDDPLKGLIANPTPRPADTTPNESPNQSKPQIGDKPQDKSANKQQQNEPQQNPVPSEQQRSGQNQAPNSQQQNAQQIQPQSAGQSQPSQTGPSGSSQAGRSDKLPDGSNTKLQHPDSSANSKGSPAGGYPNKSIGSKMTKYPPMDVNLGTVHVRRPTHSVTGGGVSDTRNVNITAHYVVDDPKNEPAPKPDKIEHVFPNVHGGPDPGNTAKSIHLGGNTSLGGGSLHGSHDHITGVKYCVPGSGGVGGSGSQSGQKPGAPTMVKSGSGKNVNRSGDRTAGKGGASTNPHSGWSPNVGRMVSAVYHGTAPAKVLVHIHNWQESQTGGASSNALHLPSSDVPDNRLTPGSAVPQADRKWVYDPQSHTDSADPGIKTAPRPRFVLSPHDIGSLDNNGTILWGSPRPVKHQKKPYGGDGTGLLGVYYLGDNFNQFEFKRPDRHVDFDWTGNSPSPMPQREPYSVRWFGTIVPKTSDTYTIMTTTDDGVRVWLDGKIIISDWTVHAPFEDTATIPLVAGQEYNIKIEYYENDGISEAVMKLYWESPSTPLQYIPESCLRYPKARLTRG